MIDVIDAPCGAGKTEWAISYMNTHPEESFIFVTPFLSEVDRIKNNVNGFYDPQPFNRKGLFGGEQGTKRKIDDFNDLLAKGKNIVTTHTTFTNATQETINNLMCNEYHLILDETVDVLLPLNNLVPRIKKDDADFLLKNRIIEVDENYRVRWKGVSQSLEGGKGAYAYSDVQRHAESENLLLIDKKFFVWEFSPEVFRAMSKVTILTYQLEGSFLYPYLKVHGFEYQKFSVVGAYGKGFELVPYTVDLEQRKKWKQLITLYQGNTHHILPKLSAKAYGRNVENKPNSEETKALKSALRCFFQNTKAKAYDVMWSCPKSCRNKIAVNGYKQTQELTADEKRGKTQEQLDKYIDANGLRCWVASNARATNSFSDRHILAYMLDLYPNPEINKYFLKYDNGLNGRDFALAGLIQWVWRSAIRKNEPITLYLPAPRMYKLFTAWLDGKR